MKKTLLIILPLLLIVGCSKPVEDSTLINKDGLMYLPDSDSPYSGEVYFNYDTGEKLYQGTYENGLLVTDSYLNKDGSVKEPINYETTLVERKSVYYTKDTNKPYSGPVFSLYEVGGQKKSEGNLKDGELNGLWTDWYENGQKGDEGTYKDGKLDGLWTSWYENGQKEREVTYKDGKRDGKWTFWYENGQKSEEGTWKEGKKDGKWTWYNDDGTVKEVKEVTDERRKVYNTLSRWRNFIKKVSITLSSRSITKKNI